MQLTIGEFLLEANNPNDEGHSSLLNPLSAEFGVKTTDEMQHLVDNVLPSFKLVGTADIAAVRCPSRRGEGRVVWANGV